MPMPKRMRIMRSSRGVSDASTRVVVSRRFDWIAASIGMIALLSSIKSPRWESSSSPIGVSKEIGSLVSDDRAVEHVEGGKQGGCAMALVVMGDAFDIAEPHGEHGLGPLEGLDLALLIDAKAPRPLSGGLR